MASSQSKLLAVDAKEASQVTEALASVEAALAQCSQAGRAQEAKELQAAKTELTGHLKALAERAARGPAHRLTPEQIEQLTKTGDPGCPRGQAYQHGESKRLIQCKGPQLLEMNLAKVTDYFHKRGFSVAVDPAAPVLRAEYGAELFVFRYSRERSAESATCVIITGAPGVPWQETVARASGVRPDKLKEGSAVIVPPKRFALRLEGSGADKTIYLGDCEETRAPAAP